jgi:hypothetical protein
MLDTRTTVSDGTRFTPKRFTQNNDINFFPVMSSRTVSSNVKFTNLSVFEPRVSMLHSRDIQTNLSQGNTIMIKKQLLPIIPDETNHEDVVCEIPMDTTATTGVSIVDSSIYNMDYFTNNTQQTNTQNYLVLIITVLYLFWIFVISLAEIDIDMLVTVSFAWIWAPVVFLQMCYLVQSRIYIILGFSVYLILTIQLYTYLTFRNSYEWNFVIDIYLLFHQTTLHVLLRGSFKFPVWSFLITSTLGIVLRVMTFGQMDVQLIVSVTHNTYLFVLVILSIIMYSNGLNIKSKPDCKQP